MKYLLTENCSLKDVWLEIVEESIFKDKSVKIRKDGHGRILISGKYE